MITREDIKLQQKRDFGDIEIKEQEEKDFLYIKGNSYRLHRSIEDIKYCTRNRE